MRLRTRLALLVTFIIVIVVLSSFFLMRQEYRAVMADRLDQQMTMIGSTVGVMLLPSLVREGGRLDEGSLAGVQTSLRQIVEEMEDVAKIRIVALDGSDLLSYTQEEADQGDRSLMQEEVVPIRFSKEGQTYANVHVLFDMSSYDRVQKSLLGRVVSVVLVSALVGIFLALYFARTFTHPIELLRDSALEFGKEKYEARAPVSGSDEVGVLAATFNDMASRIQRNIQRIRSLQEWSQQIAGELDRDKVLDVSKRAFADIGGISKMSLMLLDEATQQLEIAAGINVEPEAFQMVKFRIGEGIAGRVLETGKPVRVDNLSESKEYHSFHGKSASKGQLLALPLVAKGRCFGVINLHAKTDGNSFDEADQTLLTTLSDVVSIALENSRLYDLAITDGLTKLYIMRYFQSRLDEEIIRTHRTAQPLSLLMTDIDHFKSVNDTYGHQTGDAVLVALARVMKRVFREVDIPCRYGGEEFAVILPHTDKAGSMIAAERFRTAINEFEHNSPAGPIRFTVSCGVTTYKLGRTKSELIHEADSALYDSKRKGRNRSMHHEDMK